MPLADPFDRPEFSMVSLTEAINLIPNMFGRLNELNAFPTRGVATTTVEVERRDGVLNLLPTLPRGSAGTMGSRGRRQVRTFKIPHIPHDDVALADEVQNVRAFGSENRLEALIDLITDRLETMRNKHAITLEHLRMGALKGLIVDADGSTLYDLFAEFGIVQKVIAMALDVAGTEVMTKVHEMKRHMELNAKGEMYTAIRVLCGTAFFDSFATHDKVKAGYERWQNSEFFRTDQRRGFPYGGGAGGGVPVLWEEYIAQVDDPLNPGTPIKFIGDNDAYAFPVGTTQTFRTYLAPADMEEAVNTVGRELYASQEPLKHGKGRELHSQSNPLPLCHRPELLVKLTRT